MTLSQRFVSLSLLGGITLALAPLASAQGLGFGMGFNGRGHMGLGGTDIDADTRVEIRTQLEACREDNAQDHEAAKVCAGAVFQANGIEKPEHPPRGKGVRARMGHTFRSNIDETCGDRNDTEEWRSCAKEARGSVREDFKENHPRAFGRFQNARRGGISVSADLRTELQACLTLEDNDALRECVFGVRAQARANAAN